jgi:hypothetical protein
MAGDATAPANFFAVLRSSLNRAARMKIRSDEVEGEEEVQQRTKGPGGAAANQLFFWTYIEPLCIIPPHEAHQGPGRGVGGADYFVHP